MPLGRALWLQVLPRRSSRAQSQIPWWAVFAYAVTSATALCFGASLLVPPSQPLSSIWANTGHARGAAPASLLATDQAVNADAVTRGTITTPQYFDWDRALNVPELNPDPRTVLVEATEPGSTPAGHMLPMSPLFLAALETLAQSTVFGIMYLVSRHQSCSSSSFGSPNEDTIHHHQDDSPTLFSLMAPPIHALITASSTYALAAVAAGAAAPLTPILAMRAGGLVLLFVCASVVMMKRQRLQGANAVSQFTGAVMAMASVFGLPWLNNLDVKHTSSLSITSLAVISGLGPWMSYKVMSKAEYEEATDRQSWTAVRAKQTFLASVLLFNAALAYDDTRLVSHAVFSLPPLGFMATSAIATVLSTRTYFGNSFTLGGGLNTVAIGFASELIRDATVVLLLWWLPGIALLDYDWSPSGFKVLYIVGIFCGIMLFSNHAALPAPPPMLSTRIGRAAKTPTPAFAVTDDSVDQVQTNVDNALPVSGKEVPSYTGAPGSSLLSFNLGNCMVRILIVLSALLTCMIGLGCISPAPKTHMSPVANSVSDSTVRYSAVPSSSSTSVDNKDDPSISNASEANPLFNITLTLVVDGSLPAPVGAKNRTARPFAITASAKTIPDESNPSGNGTQQWAALIPPASTWPLRKYDRPPHPENKDLTLKDLVFSAGGNPVSIQRSVTACHTFAQVPDLDYTVMWVGEDDPEAMHGKHTFLLEAFKKVCGKYPVVMYGEPNRPDRTMHRKWFKQLAFLYETAPNTTKWFVQGDDDSIWFPRVLLSYLRSLDVDPMVDSVYLGDVSESVRQFRMWGSFAYGGGGVVISRALAARIVSEYRFCIKVREQDHVGDIMMNNCIELLTSIDGKGKNVTLTKVPIFNQLDLMERDWAASSREYLSLHMSRVPPATLHHIEYMHPLTGAMPNKYLAVHDLWQNMNLIPPRLMFRRFMVNVEGAGTAVITFGHHVRVYDKRLPLGIEHYVDFDSEMSRDPEWLAIETVLDDSKYAGTSEDEWPTRRTDYRDFWFYEFDAAEDTMVFIHEPTNAKFALTCKTADGVHRGTLHTMCGSLEELEQWTEDADMLDLFMDT